MNPSPLRLTAVSALSVLALCFQVNPVGGSEFPRGLFKPPNQSNQFQHFWDINNLGANYIHTDATSWYDLPTYISLLNQYNLKVVLKKNHSQGYGLQKYSYSQYMQYQTEWDDNQALWDLWDADGTGYYFFVHPVGSLCPDQPPGGASWHLDASSSEPAGLALKGPRFILTPALDQIFNEWKPGWPDNDDYSVYQHQIWVRADRSGVPEHSTLFRWVLLYKYRREDNGSIESRRVDSIDVKASEFGNSTDFLHFSIPRTESQGDTIYPEYSLGGTDHAFVSCFYELYWPKRCDLWIDRIETMDLERGYEFFRNDSVLQARLAEIYGEADSVQTICQNTLEGFSQSDTPRRMTFLAHGAVNDTMRQDLKPGFAYYRLDDLSTQRADHFVHAGRPQVFELYEYPFKLDGQVGGQVELDTLAVRLERVNQACRDTIDWRFIAQAVRDTTANENLRNPTGSEITVQAYMALAHGAKGIDYYCYKSPAEPINGYYYKAGLVDLNFAHNDTPFVDKWNAVKEVFEQLDVLGDTLLLLDCNAAYCARDGGFQSPILSVQFAELDTTFIEVGQFTYTGGDYLILVNRRTNLNRHISVTTDQTGPWALRDLYTQERFVSSTGDFEWIPFEAGQGRVFKLEPFNDWKWTNDDQIVLADTLTKTGYPAVLTVAAGTTIKATKMGKLRIPSQQNLHGRGNLSDSVIFTALEPTLGWRGLELYSLGNPNCGDTLSYVKVSNAINGFYSLKASCRNLLIKNCTFTNNLRALAFINSEVKLYQSTISNNLITGCSFLCNTDASILDCEFKNDSIWGLGNLGSGVIDIGHTHFEENRGQGIYDNNGTVILLRSVTYPAGGFNYICHNDLEGILVSGAGMVYSGVDQIRPGCNSIWQNGLVNPQFSNVDLANWTSNSLSAQYNYWGGTQPASSQFLGSVDCSNWLLQEPVMGSWLPILALTKVLLRSLDSPVTTTGDDAVSQNDRALRLFLDGENEAAVDLFKSVLLHYPETESARFALDQIITCYRARRDYASAITYLNEFLQNPPDPGLVHRALYHKLMNLAKIGDYSGALAIGGNLAVAQTWGQGLAEPAMIEIGMIYKYGLGNTTMGNNLFEHFLRLFPESEWAIVAAAELEREGGERPAQRKPELTRISVSANQPGEYSLHPIYPNPFNAETVVRYQIPAARYVSLWVYDTAGRLVETLVDGWRVAGTHKLTFEAMGLSSGVYFYRLRAGDFTASGKMVILK